jgi:hypothetical protein
MIKPSLTHWNIHAFVECRTRGGRWWLYAHPAVNGDAQLASLLAHDIVDPEDSPLGRAQLPPDLSPAVLDEFTWRVAGRYGGDAGNIVSVEQAAHWLERGVSMRFRTQEPFERVVDPRWEHGTWLGREELGRTIASYERIARQPAPATWCAVEAMMRSLERDFLTRLVLWLERAHEWSDPADATPIYRDDASELMLAQRRAGARSRVRR